MHRRFLIFVTLLALLLPAAGSVAAVLDLEDFCPTTAAPKPDTERPGAEMKHGGMHDGTATATAKPKCCCDTGCCEMGQSEPPIDPPMPTSTPPIPLDEGIVLVAEELPTPERLRITAPSRVPLTAAPDLFLRHRSLLL